MRKIWKRRSEKLLVLIAVVFATVLNAQTVTPKVTPSSVALAQVASASVSDARLFNEKQQQAKSHDDASTRELLKQFEDSFKALFAQLRTDKHYAPVVAAQDELQRKIHEIEAKDAAEYQKEVGPIILRSTQEKAQVDILVPTVREENGWPKDTKFDENLGTWTLGTATLGAATVGTGTLPAVTTEVKPEPKN